MQLLFFLKLYRNTVLEPRHWCQNRKLLQRCGAWTCRSLGKRGTGKQPFQLPDFIAATGIEKIRQAYIEKEDSKKSKQVHQECMQPKMAKQILIIRFAFNIFGIKSLDSYFNALP
ncbi:hypothetical protein RchiOBHm_Chr5g0006921 [Rosa chinensis]|uniref:DUF382 domain-containing protein n=1 Tax=Rosa chinensis TaxID=74649 RepID=A0A2P6Q3P5_ROSCH|nr:hypothetical protein RchiOBHm_Chr5g0006921 [Rosa chinensis]